MKVHGKKGKVKFSYKLCEGNHSIHLCPSMDEASKVLEKLTSCQPRLLTSYQNISPNPPLVDEFIDANMNLINPTLSEHGSHEFVPNHPLVEKMVDPIPSSVDCNFPIESEYHTTQVLLVSSDSIRQGGISHSYETPSNK